MVLNENSLEEYKKVALKVQERVQKELPIICGLLDAIDSSDGNIQLLPQLIHTIAVVSSSKSHLFLDGVYNVYNDLIQQGKPYCIEHDPWKSVKKTFSVVSKLYIQEKDEFLRQLNHHMSILEERKLKETDLDINKEIEKEKEYFQHVECDISSAVKSFIFLMIIGYIPSEQQISTLRKMVDLSKDILTSEKKKHENSLNTCKQILGEHQGVQ
jgi:hypothetical protein